MWLIACTVGALGILYLWLLDQRLNKSHFKRLPGRFSPSDEQLLQNSANYASIDVLLDSGVNNETGKRYLVTGASGTTGSEICRILWRRGERHVFALDIAPLPRTLQNLEGITFLKTDITSADAVKNAFSVARPDV